MGVRPYAGRCKLGHLPRLALVFPEVLNDERLHSRDTEEALARGVYGEASEVAGNVCSGSGRDAQGQAQEHLHRDRVYVDGDIYTNSVESAFSLLKRGIMGTWHRISAKHLQAYLDEMTWRFDNRKNPFLFRDTMLRLIRSDNLEYKELTMAVA